MITFRSIQPMAGVDYTDFSYNFVELTVVVQRIYVHTIKKLIIIFIFFFSCNVRTRQLSTRYVTLYKLNITN